MIKYSVEPFILQQLSETCNHLGNPATDYNDYSKR